MKKRIRLLIGLSCFLLGGASGEGAQVEKFSPQGTIKVLRQVAARFSETMVPFGDPRLEDPFTMVCPVPGRGRWVDDKTWVYDFERELPGGLRCTFQLKETVRTLAGTPLDGPRRFSFDTGGPTIRASRPEEEGGRIDENQVFLLTLDAEPEAASVQQRVYCAVEGVQERIGVRLLQGGELEKLLREWKQPPDPAPRLALQCRRTFPPRSEVKLVWGRGVQSPSGGATTADQVLRFKTREPFLARVVGKKEKPQSGFIPLLPIQVAFTAPVAWESARHIYLKSQTGKIWKPLPVEGPGPIVERVVFKGPFPENHSLTVHLPGRLQDDAGRLLANREKFPLPIKTDRYPSLAKFPSRFGIIEGDGGGLLPLTVRNLEAELQAALNRPGALSDPGGEMVGVPQPDSPPAGKTVAPPVAPEMDQRLQGRLRHLGAQEEGKIIEWVHRLRAAKRKASLFRDRKRLPKITLPKIGSPQEFEVIGVPLPEPGFYVVELESEILGARLLAKPAPFFVPAGVLVTNLAAHFKWGRASSLVWVTSLDKGDPVPGAVVNVRDCLGRSLWEGKTDADGLARIALALPEEEQLPRCRDRQEGEEYTPALSGTWGGLFVFARAGRDVTFTHSSWNEGIEPWRFNLPTGGFGEIPDLLAHTVFDRTLLRAGEEVRMKHFIRRRTPEGLAIPGDAGKFKEAVVVHAGTNQEQTLPLNWRPNGTAETRLKIPIQARLGTYEVFLTTSPDPGKTGSEKRLSTGSFRVEAFRVPLMAAVLSGPREPLIREGEVEVDLSVRYLSGGGASRLPVRLRTEITPRDLSFPDYEMIAWANGGVKVGIQTYDEEASGEEDSPTRPPGEGRQGLPTRDLILDQQGGARARLSGFPAADSPQNILAEIEFQDPNGEVQTAATRIPRYPAGLLTAIRPGAAEPSRSALTYQALVLDLQGRPLAGVEINTRLFQKKFYGHRKRLTGGFYAYDHVTEIAEAGPHCQGRTDERGVVFCEGPSAADGSVIVQVEAADPQGRRCLAHREFWIPGREDDWFEVRNDDRIDLIPDKKEWDPGEQARFQVRMPFREATVLITVEREGVLDTYVQKVRRSDPWIEIPVKDHYAPNVFVSALAVRGRIPGTRPTATFDPGKPAYKLGLAEIRVGWRAHALRVEVLPEKTSYPVRATAGVRIRVQTASGKAVPPGSEAAVAVVDEALLALKPNESWKLLEAMMKRVPCGVETATAQMMVVGKRHFGRKALPAGGGGGRQFTRELFDTLLFWQGVVPLDEKGEAVVRFPLNDSLTSFRIVAVVQGGAGAFGTGSAAIRTTQDLMILPGIPPLVREGDRFRAGFTVRNVTTRELPLIVRLSAKGGNTTWKMDDGRATVPPGEAREIGWMFTVPGGAEKLEYEAVAEESGGPVRDRVKVTQQVVPAVHLRTFQAALRRLDGPLRLEVERPAGAVPGRGGLGFAVRPKLAAGLGGVADYMRRYPYTCLEQKLSQAVVLDEAERWQSLMDDLPSYLDDRGLARYFPGMRQGSDILTSYLLSVSREAGKDIPAPLQREMLKGLRDFVEGRVTLPSVFPGADLPLRKLSALEALSRYGAAEPKLLGTLAIEPQRWPTSAVLDWLNLLERIGEIPDRSAKMREAEGVLRSRLNRQGTLLGLTTDKTDHLWWLMTSADANAGKLLLTTLSLNGWQEDHPRLARGLLERQKRGHWDTTLANAWGLLALRQFSARYEKAPVTGLTEARLHGQTASVDWVKAPEGGERLLPWPPGKEVLEVAHRGGGTPWLTVQGQAAVPLNKPLSSGYGIKKTLIPVEQKVPGAWSRGDVVRVRLDLEAQAERTWVAVNDPIPAGSRILGSGLGGDSVLLAGGEGERGRAWETYRERSFDALRVYYEYVPQGKWSLEYTLRLNQEGLFQLPETRVEALYSPEMFGELPNRAMEVKPRTQAAP